MRTMKDSTIYALGGFAFWLFGLYIGWDATSTTCSFRAETDIIGMFGFEIIGAGIVLTSVILEKFEEKKKEGKP